MKALRFTPAIAGAVLSWNCGGGKVLTDTAGTSPARGRDGGNGNAAFCGDIQRDPLNCGACGHDCIGGLCSGGTCQPVVLAAGLEQPAKMALDDANVYWTEPAAGEIMKVAKTGGAPSVVANGLPSPGAIAVNSGNIYWTDSVAGTVNKLPVAGGSPVVLATGLPAPDVIAVDATDVYFWNIGDRTVRRLAGSPVVVASGYAVAAMVLDTASLYCATLDGSIVKIPRHGGIAETLAASGLTYPGSGPTSDYGAWGVAIDTANVYWTYLPNITNLNSGMVLSVPLGGGTSTVLCAQCAGALAIAADPSGIYWTETSTGNIATVRGGHRGVLASAQKAPDAIATDNTNVYWLNFGPNGLVNGSPSRGGAIMRLAK